MGAGRGFEHLGVLLDMEPVRLFFTDQTIRQVRKLAKKLLGLVHKNSRLSPLNLYRLLCGLCVYLNLAVQMDPFLMRPIDFDMSILGQLLENRVVLEDQWKYKQLYVKRGE